MDPKEQHSGKNGVGDLIKNKLNHIVQSISDHKHNGVNQEEWAPILMRSEEGPSDFNGRTKET